MGTGTIVGDLVVAGTLKPGNSPGFLATSSSLTLTSGSTYQQDIAGSMQATALTPVGVAGFYSFLSVAGQLVIHSGSTLVPKLQNLFSADQAGFGSAPYVPKLGDQFRILTATSAITGRFSTLIQPEGLAPGTQFVSFYNMYNSNSLDLAIVPSSYTTTIASASGNQNAQSVGSVLDQIAVANMGGTATLKQDQLLYAASGLSSASSIASFAQLLSGEIYPAARLGLRSFQSGGPGNPHCGWLRQHRVAAPRCLGARRQCQTAADLDGTGESYEGNAPQRCAVACGCRETKAPIAETKGCSVCSTKNSSDLDCANISNVCCIASFATTR